MRYNAVIRVILPFRNTLIVKNIFDCISNVWILLKYWKHDIHFRVLLVIRELTVEYRISRISTDVGNILCAYKICSLGKWRACYDNLCVYWPWAITRKTSTNFIYLSIGHILWSTDHRSAHPTNSNTASKRENLHLTEGFRWCEICY